MMIEQSTNYAYKLKYMDNPTFDKVRDLSTKFYRELPQALQDELFEALNRGIDILDSEPQMTAYLYAFGKMHQAKLNYAFGKLPEEFFEQPEINIIDYGCGQALGTMCYADFLREKGCSQKVKTITLIEPSEICLERAALHDSVFLPDAEIKTVNKKFDDLTQDNIVCSEETPTLHILSNVLNMLNFDLDRFAELVKVCLKGYNQFVCVGPYFSFIDKDERMDKFLSRMEGEGGFWKTFDKNEIDHEKTWTAQILCFSTGVLVEKRLSTEVTDEDVANGIEDELGVVYSRDGKKLIICKNKKIESVSIKIGTEIISDYAFEECISLKYITIPNTVLSLGKCSFLRCFSLQHVTIPDLVTVIDDGTFGNCISLHHILIPDSVTRIGEYAFGGCSSLQQIVMPNSVLKIGINAFWCCSSLKQIILSESIAIISTGAFSHCSSLKQITIPDSVKRIGEFAFSWCSSMERIILPNSITILENGIFSGCSSLHQCTIPDSVNSIVGAFSFCSCLERIIIPNSITNIKKDAFLGCKSLRQVLIPRGSMEKFKRLLDEELWNKLVEQ